MDMSEKNYAEKDACLRCFWKKMKSWWGKDTDQNISARFLTLLIFAVGWALCGWPQPEYESIMSLSSLNVLTHLTLSSIRKHLQKVVCFIPFIYSWAFNNNVISNGKSYCCNDTYWRPAYIAASKEYLRRIQIIFMLLILLAIFFHLIFIQIGYLF